MFPKGVGVQQKEFCICDLWPLTFVQLPFLCVNLPNRMVLHSVSSTLYLQVVQIKYSVSYGNLFYFDYSLLYWYVYMYVYIFDLSATQ